MINFIEERRSLAILLITILFLLIGLVYMYQVQPIREQLKLTNANVESLEIDLQILQAQLSTGEEIDDEEDVQLQTRIPTSKNLDEILIQLNRLVTTTNSEIGSISFSNYDGTISESDILIPSEGAASDNELGEETPSLQVQSPIEGLEFIKTIAINLTVTSPNNTQAQLFLKGIEGLDRLTRVDSLSFGNPVVETEPVIMYMQLTIFYMDATQ